MAPTIKPETGKKLPSSAPDRRCFCAFFLRKEGHSIDIFEASPKPGGWLRYASRIPPPNDLLQKEVDNISEMGVNITTTKVG